MCCAYFGAYIISFTCLHNANLLIMCSRTIVQASHFRRLNEIWVSGGARLHLTGCNNDQFGPWWVRWVLVACFSFFLTKMSADMMCRENSRPPGTPNDVLPHSPESHSPHFLSIVNQHTHTHPCTYPYVPICTLNKKVNFHICEITYIS